MTQENALSVPMSKLKLYRLCRRVILKDMYAKELAPKKAKAIILQLKTEIPKLTEDEFENYLKKIAAEYPPFESVLGSFQVIKEEAVEDFLGNFIEKLMELGDLETVTRFIEEVKEHEQHDADFVEQIKQEYPDVFEDVVNNK